MYCAGVSHGTRATYHFALRKEYVPALREATKAYECHRDLLKLDPHYMSELAAADLETRLQHRDRARVHYQRVADAVPDSDEGKLARRALAKFGVH